MASGTTTKKKKRTEKNVQISGVFQPKFWENADGRCAVVKAIRRLVDEFKEDSGADSIMKVTLCERAAFLAVQLASYELDATEGRPYPVGVYTQMNNALLGLLKTLGLERKAGKVIDLKDYVVAKDKKGKKC